MSFAAHAAAAVTVTVVVVWFVCRVTVLFEKSVTWQFQPVVAVSPTVTTPEVAAPPPPTLTLNVHVPLLDATDGDVPNPLEMLGVPLPQTMLLPMK